jgi:hypothetical protein
MGLLWCQKHYRNRSYIAILQKTLTKKKVVNMTVEDLKRLWADFYGEDMTIEYPAFYKKIKKLEKEKIKENEVLEKSREI